MPFFLYVVLIPVIGVAGLKIYLKATTGVCKSRKSLQGKTAIVTGANTGIGFETALDFARRNGRVILACRNSVKGCEAQSRIIQESGNKNVILKTLDLNSFKSIRQFAEEIITEENHLDILVNNAGSAPRQQSRTEDGLNMIYATNHFGPFLLTNLLLDLLKKSSPSRIVNVTSMGHMFGSIDEEDYRAEKVHRCGKAYCNAKLATALFTRELANRLAGSGVTVSCVHPGAVNTELMRESPRKYAVFSYFMKSAKEGAQTSIHCAVSEEVEGISGEYFADCAVASPSPGARDDDLARRLWRISAELDTDRY